MKEKRDIKNYFANAGRLLLSFSDKSSIKQIFTRAGFTGIPYASIFISFILILFVLFFAFLWFFIGLGIYKSGILIGILYFLLLMPISLFIIFLLVLLLIRVFLSMIIFNRVQKIEKNLPVFLREFSTNLRAGREFVDAFEDAISPELGPLYSDLKAVLVSIRSGKSSKDALTEYSKKYDSYSIREIFEIIVSIHEGGGKLSEICEKSAKNLERIEYMKKSAVASVSNYIVFTSVIALAISPMLFALSFNLLSLLHDLFLKIATTGQNQILSGSFRIDIDFEQFKLFSYAGISLIAGCAALIISMIKRGSVRDSPLRIMIFIVAAIVIYKVAFVVMQGAFNVLFAI